MPFGHESQLLRTALRGYINRVNGNGKEKLTSLLNVDQRARIREAMLMSRTRYKNPDGTPFQPQNSDGSFPPLAGIDFPPPKT